MKIINREQLNRLRQALSATYRQRENYESRGDRQWQTQVMSQVRRLEIPDYQSLYLILFEKMLWKFSPVALTLVLLLGLAAVQIGFNVGHETASLLVEDPVDFGLYAFYAK